MKIQKFGVGDIAKLGKHRVKIIKCIYDDLMAEWWYEIKAIDLKPPFQLTEKEVPEELLSEI